MEHTQEPLTDGPVLDRLELQLRRDHPDCLVLRDAQGLTARMALGQVRVQGGAVEFFLAGERLDARPLQQDGLYSVMDAFFQLLRKLEQQDCSPIFLAAAHSIDTLTRRVAAGVVGSVILLMTLLLRLAPSWSMLAFIVPPLIGAVLLRLLGGWQLRRSWVCPRCGGRLPLEAGRFLPIPRHTSSCPHCGSSLLAPEALLRARQLLEQSRPDGAGEAAAGPAPQASSFPPLILPDPGPIPSPKSGRAACLAGAVVLLALGLVLARFVGAASPAVRLPRGLAAAGSLLLGAVLALNPAPQPPKDAAVLLRLAEPRLLTWVALYPGLTGAAFLGLSFLVSQPTALQLACLLLLTALGLLLLWAAAWLLLARKNRGLYVFPTQLVVVSAWGRSRTIPLDRIGSLRMTGLEVLRFLDPQGRRLFSVELGMVGMRQLLDWLEEQALPVSISPMLLRRAAQGLAVHRPDPPLDWQPEDRTRLHRHLKAGRLLLVLSLLLLAAGTLLPFTPMMLTRLSSEQLISLLGLGAVPITVYLLVFCPVLRCRQPQEATAAWRAMHLRIPCFVTALLAIAAFSQVHYYWGRFVFQVVDRVLLYLLTALLAIALILVLCWRASKALRSDGSLLLLCLTLVLLAYGMVYSGSLALCGPPECSPARITAASAPTHEDEDHTLTVELADGTQVRCAVTARLYERQRGGAPLVLCQRRGPLGLRMIRLLAPPAE